MQNLASSDTLDATLGAIMKRHLVWFESPDVAGAAEAEAWDGRGDQRLAAVAKLRGEDISRLQRAVISDPVARVSSPVRRGRARRSK
jgi:hypothetical protein